MNKFNILIADNFKNEDNLKKIKSKYAKMLCYEIFNQSDKSCFEKFIEDLKSNM